MQNHPDRLFAQYISNGVRCGFRIGYNRESKVISAKNNMISTAAHPSVVAAHDYIAKELLKGRTIPWHSVPAQVSRFGVIPKKHQPGEWRLIVDLSAPEGKSVNDGIDLLKQLCSLHYIKVTEVAAQVYMQGWQGGINGKNGCQKCF